jgi:uncharacterized protein YqeY
MSLHIQIKESIKEAMKAKDTVRLTVVRGLTTAFMNELVATKRTPTDVLSDDEVLAVITREAKRRKDSIEQFTAADRGDLAVDEQAELVILEEYLPTLMSIDEIKSFVTPKIAEAGEIDKTKIGQFIGGIMKDLKGRADGAEVKSVVEELLK